MGPFASTDTLFPGTPGDLDLCTDMEISELQTIGLLEPPVMHVHAILIPHLLPRWKQPCPSKSETETLQVVRRPVSTAAGSHEELNKSEQERDAAR